VNNPDNADTHWDMTINFTTISWNSCLKGKCKGVLSHNKCMQVTNPKSIMDFFPTTSPLFYQLLNLRKKREIFWIISIKENTDTGKK